MNDALPEQKAAPAQSRHAQATLEYLTTYGWAILIITIVFGLMYFYTQIPSSIPSTCNFASGFYCKDIALQSNSITHNTLVTAILVNSQQYPIKDPKFYVSTNVGNTTLSQCSPNLVLPGGTLICTTNVSIDTTIGAAFNGDLYVDAINCGFQSTTTANCVTTQRGTYYGSFTGHTEAPTPMVYALTLTAANTTQSTRSGKDALMASVTLNGYSIAGADVSFAVNNATYDIAPNMTIASSNGIASSYVWGIEAGNVLVTATYADTSNSIMITFVAPS